ncbi:hypothetical protein [Nitrosomonas sp.]|uniref:hypothetical protein n=1 Tax=Nitrosomonas sp. TaxID=42353 RepID=UPI0025FD10D7|nr:hypothetical protein [Nitrosomonas sp.]
MARKIELGSPSFVKVAIASLIGAFADATYPVKVVITNNMPRDISLPDIGLFLRHVCNPDGENRREIELQGFDQLQRLASNIGQISMLNDYQYAAMTVEEVVEEPEQDGDEEVEAKAKAEAEAEATKMAEAARVQAELDAAEKAKAAAEAESKTGDESGTENNPDLTGTGDESTKIPGADAANGESDAGKDAAPPAAPKKVSHAKKAKEG